MAVGLRRTNRAPEQTHTGYRAMLQHLVNHGYAVLGANNRGSSGYGKTFFHLDDRRHGEEDLQDIVYGRKYLESLGRVDGTRVRIVSVFHRYATPKASL